MKLTLFYLNWNPSSWYQYPSLQMPSYDNFEKLHQVKQNLRQKNPLVFAGEIRTLKEQLKLAEEGKQFIFQAGPCMEEIQDQQIQQIKNLFTLMIQSSLIISFGLEKRVIRIGRIAGQYAKPRSEMYETDGQLTYRGDIIHSLENRYPDPSKMLEAYYHSVSTLNAIRSFAKSGDLDLQNINQWIYPLTEYQYYPYKHFQESVRKSVQFIRNCGIYDYHALFREPDFYTSHEALLLHYEEAMTRQDSVTQKYYNCGAHTVWLGERTRESKAHIEYLRGIENPIGIKIGPNVNSEKLRSLIEILNPNNESGKIMLIFRLGSEKIYPVLTKIIDEIQSHQLNVLYMCDPCHANTKKIKGKKTRFLFMIQDEVLKFFEICQSKHIIPSGVHLEISGDNVTECIGLNVNHNDLELNYQSLVDPRLNALQTLDMAFYISSIQSKL